MRGRRPVGPEYADQLAGSETARLRARVILQTMTGTCRLQEACRRLGISEQRFHQLRQEMMTAAVQVLEPGQAARPAHTPTPAQEQIQTLQQQLQDKEVELRAARAREEIALVMPQIKHPSAAEATGDADGSPAEKKRHGVRPGPDAVAGRRTRETLARPLATE